MYSGKIIPNKENIIMINIIVNPATHLDSMILPTAPTPTKTTNMTKLKHPTIAALAANTRSQYVPQPELLSFMEEEKSTIPPTIPPIIKIIPSKIKAILSDFLSWRTIRPLPRYFKC